MLYKCRKLFLIIKINCITYDFQPVRLIYRSHIEYYDSSDWVRPAQNKRVVMLPQTNTHQPIPRGVRLLQSALWFYYVQQYLAYL